MAGGRTVPAEGVRTHPEGRMTTPDHTPAGLRFPKFTPCMYPFGSLQHLAASQVTQYEASPFGVKGRFVGKAPAFRWQPGALRAFANLTVSQLGGRPIGKNHERTPKGQTSFDRQGQCAAGGLTSALLRCSSFRYFHSPCRVLCTFRSPYLCNIGCRADRGVFFETPQRIRLQFRAVLHMRKQQCRGNTRLSNHGKSKVVRKGLSPTV